MKLKVSFTAILFMSYCLFLTVGCQQKKQGSDDKSVPQAIQKVIQIKYPGATITDYDKDAAGVDCRCYTRRCSDFFMHPRK